MISSSAIRLPLVELAQPLAVRLLTENGANVLMHVPVRSADFSDLVSETWRDGLLRAGHPNSALNETPMRLVALRADGSESRCRGIQVEFTLPNGKTGYRSYSFTVLRQVARRAAMALIERGALKEDQSYSYDLVVDPEPTQSSPVFSASIPLKTTLRHAPLTFLQLSLRSLLACSTAVGLVDESVFPVFYTQAAFAKVEICARRGGCLKPPVETGGVLVGSLASCPESGEFFPIITDVIEVKDAEEKLLSLAYTSRTWMQLQSAQLARQAAHPERCERFLGQAHGHSFTPGDGQTCATCEQRPTCNISSAFASLDDWNWHRAVFARQPWALCHIFGLTARGEPVHQLFGLQEGQLRARGFYLLPTFHYS